MKSCDRQAKTLASLPALRIIMSVSKEGQWCRTTVTAGTDARQSVMQNRSMGRNRRWVWEDNLSEAVWQTILRGPRPLGAVWLRASSRVGATKFASQQSPSPLPKKGKGKGQPWVANPVKSHVTPKSESTRTSSLNPDEQLQAAQAMVVKLEAALMAIGEEDPAVAGLLEALSKARLQAQVRPVQDRITHTEAFLSRSKKKLDFLNAEASRIQEELAQVSAKIRDGEHRLEALKAEAIAQPSPHHAT